jgi:hypothetical protein
MKTNAGITKPKTLGFRIAAILLVASVTVVLVEVGALCIYPLIFGRALPREALQARLAAPEPAAADDLREGPATAVFKNHILHPYLGFVANPGTYSTTTEFTRGRGTTIINEQGFPGADPVCKRAGDVVNVCIFGGSFAMNFYLDSRATLADELQKRDAFKNKRVNVTLAAMSGWKQPQQALALTYLLAQGAEYDVVANLDGFNEVALPMSENVPAGVYALYPRMWNVYASRAALPDEALAQMARVAELKQQARNRKKFFGSPLLRRSNFCLVLFAVLDRNTQSEIALCNQAAHAAVNNASQARTPETSGPRREFSELDRFLEDCAETWERCSREMDGLCRANGIVYFHLLQPNQYVPDSKPMGRAEREVAWFDGGNYGYKIAVQKGYPHLIQHGKKLEQAGEHFVDLTMAFKNVEEPLYEDTCCHVNQRGNDLLAAKMAEKIAALQPSPR